MGKGMDYRLSGLKMDRRRNKELSRMEKKMDYGFSGMKMEIKRGHMSMNLSISPSLIVEFGDFLV